MGSKLIVFTDAGQIKKPPGICLGSVIKEDGTIIGGLSKVRTGPGYDSNYAEYLALKDTIELIITMYEVGHYPEHILFKSDSELMVKQIKLEYECEVYLLLEIRNRVWTLLAALENNGCKYDIEWIPRSENEAHKQCELAKGERTHPVKNKLGGILIYTDEGIMFIGKTYVPYLESIDANWWFDQCNKFPDPHRRTSHSTYALKRNSALVDPTVVRSEDWFMDRNNFKDVVIELTV